MFPVQHCKKTIFWKNTEFLQKKMLKLALFYTKEGEEVGACILSNAELEAAGERLRM